ncbi:MAG: Gldg family protein [Candidatus Cloacimonetes bacterium]|nr:Gldg family protein [Candidatus Cloacimonadota bacterium]
MKQFKKTKSVQFNVIILIAVLVFLNLVSLSMFHRFDLTKGKVYSLSKSSKNVVKQLPERLVIKAYYSKNLPAQYADARRYANDILSEYQAYSRGKLRFEFLDPTGEEDLKDEARKYRIQPLRMQVAENDQFVSREVYMGLVFLYRDKTETIPVVQGTQGLEYEITSTIKRITSQGLKKIGLFAIEKEVAPMPGRPQREEYATLKQLIGKNYEVRSIDLISPIGSDIKALLFAGIEDSLTTTQLYNLDQFIMGGGNVLFFQDRILADLQAGSAHAIKSNLFDLLNHYGIRLEQTLITDANCGQIQIQRQQGFFRTNTPINFPFFPLILKTETDHIIAKDIEGIQLIFASKIDTLELPHNVNFTPLLWTSKNSGEVPGPNPKIDYTQFLQKDLKLALLDNPKTVSGIFTGSFASFFAMMESHDEGFINSTSSAQLLVVSDSDIIKETGSGRVPGNIEFVLNSIDYMAGDEDLISIRSRGSEFYPLKDVAPDMKKVWKWINILLPSLAAIIIGLIIMNGYANRKKVLREIYEEK